jgi:hypothetical protein
LRGLAIAAFCLVPIYIGAQDPDLHYSWTATTQVMTTADDAVVIIANHRWLPADGEYSKEGDLTIYPGGVIKFKKGLTIDAAAKKFWAAVGTMIAKQPCDPTHILAEAK